MRNEAACEECSKTKHYRAVTIVVTIIVTTCRCISKAKLPRNSAKEAKGSQRKPGHQTLRAGTRLNEEENGSLMRVI